MYFKIICFTVFFLFSGSSYSQYIELEYCFKISDDKSCVWKIQFDDKTQISSYLLDSDVLYVKTVKILDKNSGDITEIIYADENQNIGAYQLYSYQELRNQKYSFLGDSLVSTAVDTIQNQQLVQHRYNDGKIDKYLVHFENKLLEKIYLLQWPIFEKLDPINIFSSLELPSDKKFYLKNINIENEPLPIDVYEYHHLPLKSDYFNRYHSVLKEMKSIHKQFNKE